MVVDNRLLAIEELLRQHKYGAAAKEIESLSEEDFGAEALNLGIYLSLRAESLLPSANYRSIIELGLRAYKLLADSSENRRFGHLQWVLSQAYSGLGDFRNAEIRARDALSTYRRASDTDGQANALNELAWIMFARNDFAASAAHLEEALGIESGNPRKVARLTGNLGRIRVLTGQWTQAEADLKHALQWNLENNEEKSEAINLLSLGYLQLRKRDFAQAGRLLDKAAVVIARLDMKRERVIHLEYAGELAYERGEILKAKNLFYEAYQGGRLIAPESALVSQASRRLAEADLALDNIDDAMRYAQKGLELAMQLGERTEVAMSHRVIARIFEIRGNHADAVENIHRAVEVARQVGDPYDVAQTLLVSAEILAAGEAVDLEAIRGALDEASRIFKKLKLEFWQAETDYRAGMSACQRGDLARGFRKLSRAEKVFAALDERPKVRAVHQFLQSLTDQAVALSISEDNEYGAFGSMMSPAEVNEFRTGMLDETLHLLVKKTRASRAIIYAPDFEVNPVTATFPLTTAQQKKFIDGFQALLGQEISQTKPTLLLDCRRDPYINGLFPDQPDIIASVLVVPFTMADQCVRYLYADKLSVDGMLNPFNQSELNFAVGFSGVIAFKAAELQKMRLVEDNRRLKAQLQQKAAFPNIITRNSQLLDMLTQLRQVIDSPISITIEGETGSGKDLVARAIHYNSVRRNKRFISVNCAALPETLLESELFGYRRGAFTGADRDKPGLFEEADGGTFFLDEIADMPLSIQAKVLRVLEEKELVRLGETVPRKVDVRIISATNKDLKAEMAKGLFRQDLYYRLSALSYQLPPLRERKEDIPLLVAHFLEESGKRITPDTMRALVAYDWPGNIRELENEMKKLVLLAGDSDEIRRDLLAGKITGSVSAVPVTGLSQTEEQVTFGQAYSLYDYLAFWEKKFIVQALREQNGVKKHAAAQLNIPESTLRLKIKQYDIDLNRLDAVN
ncbi:hypothetical protein C3F09_02435 [candidate division GN15 bacterium]|uniref:Sigma-54 factor interaction domain-containing protein n=1 Tax=candidate division GN15 bacterium TaxID=2072418 RepID=A0A855X3R5_9BACT|nr:MAG: hypothetical protein C3F09_02435 [candidate division GN15 bacterium]